MVAVFGLWGLKTALKLVKHLVSVICGTIVLPSGDFLYFNAFGSNQMDESWYWSFLGKHPSSNQAFAEALNS